MAPPGAALECSKVDGGAVAAPALPGYAPFARPLPSSVACALLCQSQPACRGFGFQPVAAGDGQCTLAATERTRTWTRRVNVTTLCEERQREGADAEDAAQAAQTEARRAAKLRRLCGAGLPSQGESGGGLPANLTLLVAGPPRTGSTWQHRALYELTLFSPAYATPPAGVAACGAGYLGLCRPAFGYVRPPAALSSGARTTSAVRT